MWIKNKKNFGFTLIELLIVIAIIGLLSSVVFASLNSARKKARDARRLSDINQVQIALEMYYDKNNAYPDNTDNDCSGWDSGFNGGQGSGDPFIQPLETDSFMRKTPGDPIDIANCEGYAYYRYNAGNYNCDSSRGAYYVLGVRNMETSGNPYPGSHGWSCPLRNWQLEFDWVVGRFEN